MKNETSKQLASLKNVISLVADQVQSMESKLESITNERNRRSSHGIQAYRSEHNNETVKTFIINTIATLLLGGLIWFIVVLFFSV